MMISPESYIMDMKDKTYIQLLSERDDLLKKIMIFEKNIGKKTKEDSDIMDPSPEVIYQCNLEYLSSLCMLISKKYNEEFINLD